MTAFSKAEGSKPSVEPGLPEGFFAAGMGELPIGGKPVRRIFSAPSATSDKLPDQGLPLTKRRFSGQDGKGWPQRDLIWRKGIPSAKSGKDGKPRNTRNTRKEENGGFIRWKGDFSFVPHHFRVFRVFRGFHSNMEPRILMDCTNGPKMPPTQQSRGETLRNQRCSMR